jgi:phosphomannomutase
MRSAVGEANVADMMIANQAAYGGEGNGGPIDPRVGYVRDSFVAMAQVLDLMASSEKSLAALADAMPQLHIHKSVVSIDAAALPILFEQLTERFADAEVQTGDGIRLAWSDRWLLVRGSNTEPIVRVIAEAEELTQAESLCEEVAEIIGQL